MKAFVTKRFALIASVFLFSLVVGCAPKPAAYVLTSPPFHPFATEHSRLAYVGAPPIMQPPVKTIDEIDVSCQYFKIVVPLVLDRSAKLEGIKNLIDEQFTTALDATKRFTVMDKTTMLNIMHQSYSKNKYDNSGGQLQLVDVVTTQHDKLSNGSDAQSNNPVKTAVDNNNITTTAFKEDSTNARTVIKSTSAVYSNDNTITDFYGLLETDPALYEKCIRDIGHYTDGILKIVITGNDEEHSQLDIDYRINSTLSENKILYSGSGKIGYVLGKGTSSKSLNREDVEKIANEIKLQFPNPDLKTLQIVELHGNNKITVNAGKKDNIKEGMIGYVVKKVGTRYAYRAMFEVTEVFSESFNGVLRVESIEKLHDKGVNQQDLAQYNRILNSIKVGEQVQMK